MTESDTDEVNSPSTSGLLVGSHDDDIGTLIFGRP